VNSGFGPKPTTPRPSTAHADRTPPCLRRQTYVEVEGRLYELDGNNDGPLDCGPVGADGLLKTMVAYVQEHYIAAFPDSHYSLITLGPRQVA